MTSINISLGRTLADIPDDLVKGETYNNNYIYPENGLHATDICKWLIDQTKKNTEIHIITQSDTIVSFFGALVCYGVIKSERVIISIYEKGKIERVCYFDKDGALTNWAFGWFLPDMEVQNKFIRELNPKANLS